jgi:hypothetical protein
VKALFQAIVVAAVALVSVGGQARANGATSDREGPAPQSAWDCASACNDCESDCGRAPAGNPREACVRGCASSAARCCSGYGKKPPGADCYCR